MKPLVTIVFSLLFPIALGATEATEAPQPETATDMAAQVETEGDTEDAVLDPDSTLLFLDAREVNVRDFIWERRIIVVMAETPDDPQFNRQLEALRERSDDFVERDAIVIFDAHPADRSALRQVLRPRAFMTAIIDKDGEVKARRPAVRSGRELMAVIDRFPTRRQEMLERRPSGR
ncbi:DUF4174 domain-containing protein [Roseinatronobacter bogoriensis]|nr:MULTISPECIES: DUF4174 domain-containing protein [Rhodobaca]MBB4207706.1 hypothetical protein [Rhodobaca bogoriensis DSM 18756]TDW39987.1 uncharacterized protein DUF4174 [Rhodobaca barguzinensis]TDY70860.1 uncharacterized protein DUF4174 [Rhodobaca bogoriensis DSM 18756]